MADRKSSSREPLTRLLDRAREGDAEAADLLLRSIYDELRSRARAQLRRERDGHTFQPTDLVNEVCVRLFELEEIPGRNRAQLLAYASRAMRHILVDRARARRRLKRGRGHEPLPLDDALAIAPGSPVDLLALDDALTRLARIDERKARVVEMRYFGGLGVEETAAALGVSAATVKSDWRVARTWLYCDLRDAD